MIYKDEYYAFRLVPQFEVEHSNFLSTDSAKEYSSNVRKLGKEWEWYGVDIDYNFNSMGYRSKNPEDLDDNYLLAFGCSYTEGIGLNEEDIYISKLSKHFNLDLLNLSHGGQGIDYCFYNTINYINKMKKKPKLVVYQWPFETRKSFLYAEKISPFNFGTDFLSAHYDDKNKNRCELLNMDDKWYDERFLADEGEMLKQMLFYIDATNLLWKGLNIPVLNFHWPSVEPELSMYNGFMLDRDYPFFIYKIDEDRARDIVHAGKKSHSTLCTSIIKDIDENNIYTKETII